MSVYKDAYDVVHDHDRDDDLVEYVYAFIEMCWCVELIIQYGTWAAAGWLDCTVQIEVTNYCAETLRVKEKKGISQLAGGNVQSAIFQEVKEVKCGSDVLKRGLCVGVIVCNDLYNIFHVKSEDEIMDNELGRNLKKVNEKYQKRYFVVVKMDN